MSTFPAENSSAANAALDRMAHTLVVECDGFRASIADLLDMILEADVEGLAKSLRETAQPVATASLDVDKLEPPVDSRRRARRRLSLLAIGDARTPTRTLIS
jgi:hypothetical protein